MTINMVNVFFFAKLREQLNCGHLQLTLTDYPLSIKQLVDAIGDLVNSAEEGVFSLSSDEFVACLMADNIVMAVNHQVVKTKEFALVDGDEIAFYPPVTGG